MTKCVTDAREVIRTPEPLREWTLNPSPLTRLGNPRSTRYLIGLYLLYSHFPRPGPVWHHHGYYFQFVSIVLSKVSVREVAWKPEMLTRIFGEYPGLLHLFPDVTASPAGFMVTLQDMVPRDQQDKN